jgi:polyhydroxyalkanoate synthesis regulator phasin
LRLWNTQTMSRRRSTSKELPDAVRDAVDRTVQATVGSAERSRDRAQEALDGVVDRVRGAEASITRSRRVVTEAIDDRMPATHEDIKELKAELRAVARRLEAIEQRLPAPRKKPAAAPRKRAR